MTDDNDPLRPARGIFNGMILGAVAWAVVLLIIFVVLAGCGSADDEPQRTCFRCQAGQGFVLQTTFSCGQSQWQGQDGRSCYTRYPGARIVVQ